jgi:hypothetical protein
MIQYFLPLVILCLSFNAYPQASKNTNAKLYDLYLMLKMEIIREQLDYLNKSLMMNQKILVRSII